MSYFVPDVDNMGELAECTRAWQALIRKEPLSDMLQGALPVPTGGKR